MAMIKFSLFKQNVILIALCSCSTNHLIRAKIEKYSLSLLMWLTDSIKVCSWSLLQANMSIDGKAGMAVHVRDTDSGHIIDYW